MKFIAHAVKIHDNDGTVQPGIYIHNEDFSYQHWVYLDGTTVTSYKGKGYCPVNEYTSENSIETINIDSDYEHI